MGSIRILAAGIIITGLSAASVTACGGGGSPSAASILTSDGYRQISTSELSKVWNSLPSGDVSSSAVGVSTGNSSEARVVFVLTSQGVRGVSSDLATGQSESRAAGITTSLNGDVLTMTGTEQAFNALPG